MLGARSETVGNASGFDSLTSRSLTLRSSRPCRGFPSRSILDFARDDVGAAHLNGLRRLRWISRSSVSSVKSVVAFLVHARVSLCPFVCIRG